MTTTKTLGGDRLGSGNKQKIQMHGFERSTHDLSYIWRNTQAPGTLVPFMSRVALPGDNWDIELNAQVLTHPTVGPLFASFKLQLDVFQCPIRLYHSWLHNNKLKIGNNMSQVKLPYIQLDVNPLNLNEFGRSGIMPIETQQIHQSSLFSYLGIRGIGQGKIGKTKAQKNAIPYLAYWDIYKNYYANKQEEKGYVVHTAEALTLNTISPHLLNIVISNGGGVIYTGNGQNMPNHEEVRNLAVGAFTVLLQLDPVYTTAPDNTTLYTNMVKSDVGVNSDYTVQIDSKSIQKSAWTLVGDHFEQSFTWTPSGFTFTHFCICGMALGVNPILQDLQNQINLYQFDLSNIDQMREDILANNGGDAFEIDANYGLSPYDLPLKKAIACDGYGQICAYFNQEGLAIKTYQSDIFNNWLNTEWIDGSGGINEITAVDTSGGSFDINTLNLAQKVYDMLNRIAVSGGSYDDWMEAVYDHDGYRKAETPMYMGGLSKEIIFQEVVSTAATTANNDTKPLGTLAGRGTLSQKHKGGKVTINVNEPSYIIGIVSITPRIDYSQGNNWDTLLETMDDLHKPSLDEIGFQELVTDQMAFWDSVIDESTGDLITKSAGKQPAWINYMTDYNRLHGNFADKRNEMFMTLARRYEVDIDNKSITDLTTYIDPTKFNYAFAETDLTAQNFWVQIACDVKARRKMSAKVMPNL